MTDELRTFVHHARERGLDFASIRALLTSSGWKDRQIVDAFCAGELELRPPQPVASGSARDTLLHLLAFTALYTWVVSLILLLFAFVDIALPDPAWQDSDWWRRSLNSGIRRGLASIVVAYPAFLLLWSYLLRDIRRHPDQGHTAIRRWLMFLSLFVGAITIATDVITLVYFLFEGQLTTRIVLKALVLFLIAGTGLTYLALCMRHDSEARR
jgi:hypothetical protein